MLQLVLMRDGARLLSRVLDGNVITIGRSEDNHIQLDDDTISRSHCRLERRDAHYALVDTSRNGTLVNGEPVDEAVLSTDDLISIGSWTARLTTETARNEETVVEHAKATHILSYDDERHRITEERMHLTIISPDQRESRRSMLRSDISFGSAASNTVAIADEFVSRRHCSLVIRDGALLLIDHGSTNGTFVGGVRIDRVALPDEGTFVMGTSRVRYRRERITEDLRPHTKESLGAMIGKSEEMRTVFSLIAKAAPTDIPVCILGESGTGKELASREIHRLSERADGPFVAVNCGALPAAIVESVLFGHERGAFTGAVERQAGVFEQAHGGTLLLDEVGEMDPALQTRLLRVLEQGVVRRVGARGDTPVDVRIVVATNRDLRSLVRTNAFREDLFYRLYVLPIRLPPLRQRADDIPAIARHILAGHQRGGRGIILTDAALARLARHEWHGNVRELKNTLLRALITAEGTIIDADDISFIESPRLVSEDSPLDNRERETIIEALRSAGGNQTQACKFLGIARSTMAYKIGKYKIDLKRL